MANEDRCVFCGQPVNPFRANSVQCGNIYQLACKTCAKELNALEPEERCRRALLRGLADRPERIQEFLKVNAEAEDHRPACPSCGGKLRYLGEQSMDSSPLRDGIFSSVFVVMTACCPDCGRYEFFNPEIVRKNPFLAHLILKDTTTK